MARSLGVLVTSGLLWLTVGGLLAGCGGGDGSTSAPAAAGTSGGERPVARRIEPTRPATEAPRVISREAFDAQWASTEEPAPFDMSGVVVEGAVPPGGPYGAYGGMGADLDHPIPTCGAAESYALVASHVCPDGTMPLGGDLAAGAGARVGNVGANATGHIIDLYSVPCATGPVELYVDLYACPGGGSPF